MAREELIDLPKKVSHKLLHPSSTDLILSLVASGAAFTFWNAINIKPSMLTDPGYQEYRDELAHHMNITMAIILLGALGMSAVYKDRAYLASLSMIGTGAIMYIWSTSELYRLAGDETYPITFSDTAVHPDSVFPQLWQPARLPPKTRREHAAT